MDITHKDIWTNNLDNLINLFYSTPIFLFVKILFYLPFIHIYKDTHTHIYVSINLSIPLRKKRKKASILSPSYGKTEEIWINCYKNLRWNLLPRDSNSANDGNIKVITCIFHGHLDVSWFRCLMVDDIFQTLQELSVLTQIFDKSRYK